MIAKTTSLILFLFVASAYGVENRTLWTRTLTPEDVFIYRVGSDGTVAIVDNNRGETVNTIYWIARSGETIREIQPNLSHFFPQYVTQDELIVDRGDDEGMSLYQFVGSNQLEHTVLNQRFPDSGVRMGDDSIPFSYPYLVLREDLSDGSVEFSLLDLTSPNALRVVGDAVIGVHGKNLKVRWKTVVNAKYKVQFTFDMVTWTDYTEVIDGTGATVVVKIPLDENADSLYARVVKL